MNYFISLKASDKTYADSFIADCLKAGHNYTYWYSFDIPDSSIGHDSSEEILKQIQISEGALLLVSKAFLESSFIQEKELPAIFKKKSNDPNYKVIPVFLENCDISKNIFLKDLEFYNSPSTSLKKIKSRSAKEFSDKVTAINSFINDNLITKKKFSFQKVKYIFYITTLLVFLMGLFTLNQNRNMALDQINESSVPEPSLEKEPTVNFDSLKVGDCYDYENLFLAYVLEPSIADKNSNSDVGDSSWLSLALENGYIGDNVYIVDCNSSHTFEVTYVSSSFPLNEDYEKILDGFPLQEFCVEKSFYYSGNKIKNINSFNSFQYVEKDGKLKFLCASFEYGDNKQVIKKTGTHKNFQLLNINTIYEARVNELEEGDCFLHNNAWGVKEYENTWRIDGSNEFVEVVECTDKHDYEIIYQFEVERFNQSITFPGVSLPFTVKDIPSQENPIIEKFNIDGYENYEGATISSIITSNNYLKTISSRSVLESTKFDLRLDENVFIEVLKQDGYGYHFIKIPVFENLVNVDDYNLLTNADSYCENIPVFDVPVVYESNNSDAEWTFVSISNGSIESQKSVTISCLARLTSKNSLEAGGLQSDKEIILKETDGSIVKGFSERYGYNISNIRDFYINSNETNFNLQVKKLTELNTGDCFQIQTLYDYSKYSKDTWNEDWFIVTSSCNHKHTNEVIIAFDELSNNETQVNLENTCDDYLYYDLQFSKKVTAGNFKYSQEDYENENFLYSQEGLSLKDVFRNKYFIKNLIDRDTNSLKSLCFLWQTIDGDSEYAYISALESFEPTELSISNYYCPNIVNTEDETEVVFEFTRGSAEIISLNYIEISGDKAREDDGFEVEGASKDEIKNMMNNTFEGLSPSIIEFVTEGSTGTITATIVDESGNSDSAVCNFEIKK